MTQSATQVLGLGRPRSATAATRRRPRSRRRIGNAALFALAALACAPASAQNIPPALAAAGDPAPSYLTPPPLRANNPLLHGSRDYEGIALSDWMFYPEFLGEAIYNDNPAQSSVRSPAAEGVHLHPDLYALRDSGIAKTEVFTSADAYLYPAAPRDNVYNGTFGVAETYALQPDLTIKGEAEFDRLGGFASGGSVLGPGGVALPLVAPSQYNQAQASLAVQKSFGRLFLGLSLTGVGARYDPLATAVGSLSQSYRDSFVTTLTERGGYWISPLLYGYVETAENWRDYADASLASRGYRAVAGLGSDRLSLFRGEIYAGYQRQIYDPPLPGAASSPVVGAKLHWYPTRALTLSAELDESFTDSSNPAPGNPRGNPARDLGAKVDATYQLHRSWWGTVELKADRDYFIGVARVDTTWIASTRIDYQLRRNVDLTLAYSYIRNNSNFVGDSYAQDLASLGALYKF